MRSRRLRGDGGIEEDDRSVITVFEAADVDSDAQPELAAALKESRTRVTSQTGYFMRFGGASHRELTVFDVVGLPGRSYPVSESAYASLPEDVRDHLTETGSTQIVATYDSDSGVFRDVSWPDAPAGGQAAGEEQTASETRESTQRYHPITRSEFEEFLASVDDRFERQKYGWTNEWVYDLMLEGGRKCLRVLSSIDRRDNASRGAGRDAIRSKLLLDVEPGQGETLWRPVRPSKRTYRIETWRKNLREKLEHALAAKDELKECPECGRPMVVQSSKGSSRTFWGCSGYYESGPGMQEHACPNTEAMRTP